MAKARRKALPTSNETHTSDNAAVSTGVVDDPATSFNVEENERKPAPQTKGTALPASESPPAADSEASRPAAEEQTNHAARHREHAPGHIANPSSKRRESYAASVGRRLPSTMSMKAGDATVELIDKGDNLAGVGIRVVFEDGRKPTEEEKEIIRRVIKGEDGEQTGYTWLRDTEMWHKPIVRANEFADEVPPSRPVAVRLDAESRVQKLGEALRERLADPVGFAEAVKQRREQAAESGRIPD